MVGSPRERTGSTGSKGFEKNPCRGLGDGRFYKWRDWTEPWGVEMGV